MTTTDTKPRRTKEEIEASVRKANAEATLAEAEAGKAAAEARSAVLKAEHEERARRHELANDDNHHVLRFNGNVDAASVSKAMKTLSQWHRLDDKCDIEIVFDSPGGSVFDGFALFDHILWLRSQGHKVTTGTVGMAASMAGVLMQAGEHRWAGSQAWYLIHRAAFGAMGSTYEVEDRVTLIKRVEKRIVNIFVERSDLTARTITRNWERKDWWLSPEQQLEHGLVDEIRGAGL